MNVKRQICQEGIWHELTQVASPQPAGMPLISHSAHHNLPYFEEISQCLDFRQCLQCKDENVSKLPYKISTQTDVCPYLIRLRECLNRPNFYIPIWREEESAEFKNMYFAEVFPPFIGMH